MLKIKDNVDLKELEKFGFKFNNDTGKYILNVKYEEGKGVMEFVVRAWDRKIYIWSNTSSIRDERLVGVIYDLIKADLVEKV